MGETSHRAQARTRRARRIFVGVGTLVVVVLAAASYVWFTRSFGPLEVTIRNAGSVPEKLQLALLTETGHSVLSELEPFTLQPGRAVTSGIDRTADAVLQLRVSQGGGAARRYTLQRYLGHMYRMEIVLEVVDGKLTQARVRKSGAGAFEELSWTMD